jgi:hypothetical protein
MAQGRSVAPPASRNVASAWNSPQSMKRRRYLRPVFQQAVAVGIEQQHRHLPGQIRQRAGWCPIDAGGQLTRAAFDADRNSPPRRRRPSSPQFENQGASVLNQFTRLAGAKRASAPQNVQRLQQAGLAGGVGADQQVQAGRTVGSNPPQIAKPGDVERGNPHPQRDSEPHRHDDVLATAALAFLDQATAAGVVEGQLGQFAAQRAQRVEQIA